jgi:methyl-accepting chemotaxis protein
MSASSSTSKGFELSPQLLLGLAGVLGLSAAAIALWQTPDNYVLMGLCALSGLLLLLGSKASSRENELLARIDHVLSEAAQGQLEARITQIPVQGRLVDAAWRVNDMLDQIEAVFRESMTVVTRMGSGDFSRQPQAAGLKGLYPQVLAQIATVQKNMDSTVQILSQSMGAMAQGDFEHRVSTQGQTGQFLSILNDARKTLEALDNLISDVVNVMDAVSNGDLSQRVRANGEGALGKLKDDINNSLQALAISMRQIGENAQQVAGAANDTSTAIGQLADGAQSQTQFIGHMVSAIRQTAAAVSDIASNTEHASRQAQESTTIVRDGQNKMVQMVDVVNGIALSSEKINKITDVIEKIANKTNLLSLNAAIEAARAGEHGKGFAVVADEVGKLAASSAESTKEITQLIQQASQQAKEAVVAVKDVSADMERIVKSSTQTDGMLQRISASVEEQTRMIQEINTSVENLEQIARSNSAASEELAASMIELSKVADSTRTEITKFST